MAWCESTLEVDAGSVQYCNIASKTTSTQTYDTAHSFTYIQTRLAPLFRIPTLILTFPSGVVALARSLYSTIY
jgi:hypothetical protein